MKKIIYYSLLYLFAFTILASCEEEEQNPLPIAEFTYTVDANDPSTIKFINASTNFTSVLWDFGDKTQASIELNPSHQYVAGGNYTVKLSVLGKNGQMVSISKEVNIAIQNSLKGGDFSSGEHWYTMEVGSEATDASFANGVLTFTGDGTKNLFVYQEIKLVPGDYFLTGDVKIDPAVYNSWLEFYLLTEQEKPRAGIDILKYFWGYTSFDGCKNKSVNSRIENITSCKNGSFKVSITEAGTYYFGIKVGTAGGSLGTGIVLDNIKFEKQ